MRARFPAAARVAGFLLAAALLLLGLRALAGWMVETHLRHAAERELHLLQAGEPLWRWNLQRPRDLVAGHPFGDATASASGEGLRVSSRSGQPFELGLPVMQPLDLAHWPLLRLLTRGSEPGELSVVVQAHAGEPACTAKAGALPTAAGAFTVDLRKLDWRHEDGSACAPPAAVTYLFRLRPRLPAGATLEWREAVLLADGPVSLPGPSPSVDLSAGREIDLLEQLTANPTMPPVPLVWLMRDGSVETWLGLRDRLRASWPAAVIVPAGAALVPAAHDAPPPWLSWLACAVYLLLLLASARRDNHPAWDVVAVTAGPLWLIAGLQWGLHASPPAVTAFVAALAWAAWREHRRRPADWHWLGGQAIDWLLPLMLLPLAWSLALLFGPGFKAPEWRHAFLYVAWASLQQWLMLAVVLRRLERWPGGSILPILGAATLFALLHTPNGVLMQLCFVAEVWWAWCFLRSRRLLPIALAHAGCALLVESGLAGGVLRSLEVSARFFL